MSTATLDLKEGIAQVFSSQAPDPKASPVHERRLAAFNTWQALDYPTIKHEEWKYTNLRKLVSKSFAYQPDSALDMAAIQPFLVAGADYDLMVFINGTYKPELSTITQAQGISIMPFSQAVAQNHAQLAKHFAKYAQTEGEVFTALNTAFAEEGCFIHIGKSKVASRPIMLLHLLDTSQGSVMAQPRNLIVAEENAQITVFEDYLLVGEQEGFLNMVTEVVVASNALVEHHKLQNKSEKFSYVGTTQVYQASNSKYHNTTITMGGGLLRNNLNISLDGEYCEAFMNGLYMLKDRDHVDNHTVVDHMKPNSYSNELYKGILDDQATGVFNGKIFVRQDAQKTNAFQSNKNILLSDSATVNTKPQLEIWADDVKCSHGCTTGALDEEPLFYLRSRGIPENSARALLMHAFAADVLNRINSEPFKLHIEKLISERLGV